MTSFLSKLKSNQTGLNTQQSGSGKKQGQVATVLSPIETVVASSGPIRQDGSDKFFGMHNPSNTCYCNSVLQCLYFSEAFRSQIVKFPLPSAADAVSHIRSNDTAKSSTPDTSTPKPGSQSPTSQQKSWPSPTSPSSTNSKVEENKESFEYQKKQAFASGPLLRMEFGNFASYGMPESLYTGLKDIFEAVVAHQSRTGIVMPSKFLEVLKRNNETFRSPMHQDAHEFLILLLNEIVEEVDKFSKAIKNITLPSLDSTSPADGTGPITKSMMELKANENTQTGTSWVHELFEGTLSSETRCLTCETISRRDETFLDLSVDSEEQTSITYCLQKFSEEEMLCERNKFHCDNCGGLQEAEKRMKLKKLPRILALHLKRFKYTEDLQRLQKLFHRVVFPFELRLLNTTDDAEDPDRLYELYAVIVHLGSTPFHGHYVSIIKTKDKGWLLFDDELVLPVEAEYVRKFFGGDPRNSACAYVLFYQETTEEQVQSEWDPAETTNDDVFPSLQNETDPKSPSIEATSPVPDEQTPWRTPWSTPPTTPHDPFASLAGAMSQPMSPVTANFRNQTQGRKSLDNVDDAIDDMEPEDAHADDAKPTGKEQGKVFTLRSMKSGSFNRFRPTSMSLRQKPKLWGSKERDKEDELEGEPSESRDAEQPPPSSPVKEKPEKSEKLERQRSRFGLGRKKPSTQS